MAATNSHSEIQYEPDATGQSAGVELEQLADDDDRAITEPFDPRRIDVVTETRSLDVLIKRLEANLIDLDPDFQRLRGIWNANKKSQLIESLLLRIPLPTFYVAEVQSGEEFGEDTWTVVDGIQRLSTIAEFVSPATLGLAPLRLAGLEYLDREEGKTFEELSRALRLRVLESQFTMQVIRKTTPELVKLNIFARINTGGMALSAQELRNALTPGPARKVLRDLAESNEFQTAVDHSVKPSRMADREMVLRFLAFRMTDPIEYRNQDFDSFLRDSMVQINAWSPSTATSYRNAFCQAMEISASIFSNDAFRKRYSDDDSRRPVSKALFEGVAVAIASVAADSGPAGVELLLRRKKKVRAGFMTLMHDREFDRSISQGTGDPVRVRYRFTQLNALMRTHATP